MNNNPRSDYATGIFSAAGTGRLNCRNRIVLKCQFLAWRTVKTVINSNPKQVIAAPAFGNATQNHNDDCQNPLLFSRHNAVRLLSTYPRMAEKISFSI